jgi:lysine 2,3-aminomutase
MPPLTRVDQLLHEGLARPEDAPALDAVAEAFRIRISAEMRGAITSAADPIGLQFIPSDRELGERPEELHDPIGDRAHAPVPGLTHRYHDRVILHATQTCEVYCRFCFRRETVGATGTLPDEDLDAALAYIADTPQIWEVILTGGDPLVLSRRRLKAMLQRLAAIPHVGVVRFHTRVPVVAPEKITAALLEALQSDLSVFVVLHTNHVQELTPAARSALDQLNKAGIGLLSQSVLLRGINDSTEALADLFRALIRCKVKPYYLHHCDLARGTSHFRTTIAEGQALMAALRGKLSGICLPSYVLDIPGGFGKVPIGPGYLQAQENGLWRVTDPKGQTHLYQDPER